MTVNKIIPCVCCEHPPSSDDENEYGMPILIPIVYEEDFKDTCARHGWEYPKWLEEPKQLDIWEDSYNE